MEEKKPRRRSLSVDRGEAVAAPVDITLQSTAKVSFSLVFFDQRPQSSHSSFQEHMLETLLSKGKLG